MKVNFEIGLSQLRTFCNEYGCQFHQNKKPGTDLFFIPNSVNVNSFVIARAFSNIIDLRQMKYPSVLHAILNFVIKAENLQKTKLESFEYNF